MLLQIVGLDSGCLTLDVFTGSVVYDDLAPVIAIVDGDDADEEEEVENAPDSDLAVKHGVVFVRLNYRRGTHGFMSTNSLSR